MNYLILVLFIFLLSCSSNKEKDLVDVEYYIKQGKEISLLDKSNFTEISKVNKLQLSKPVVINNWLNDKLNTRNNLPRFFIEDFKKKIDLKINIVSFLVIKNNIYLVDSNSNLIVLNEKLNEIKRKPIYKKKEFKDYVLDFSMTSDGESIYVSDNLGNVHCIRADDFKVKWTLKLGVPIKSSLYLSDNNLFFVNTNSKIYSINSSNGDINWSRENASKIIKDKYQISISNNLLISNNDYGEIYCLDLEKKNLLWKLNLEDNDNKIKLKNFKISYLVNNEGILYFSSNYGETIAVNESSGKILWKKFISVTNLPVINSNYIFLLNDRGLFYILNKKNGDIIYSKDLNKFYLEKKNAEIIFYDIILGKDYIYFTNSSKSILKIDINNLNIIKKDKQFFNNQKNFFVLNNYLYIFGDKSLSMLYN